MPLEMSLQTVESTLRTHITQQLRVDKALKHYPVHIEMAHEHTPHFPMVYVGLTKAMPHPVMGCKAWDIELFVMVAAAKEAHPLLSWMCQQVQENLSEWPQIPSYHITVWECTDVHWIQPVQQGIQRVKMAYHTIIYAIEEKKWSHIQAH